MSIDTSRVKPNTLYSVTETAQFLDVKDQTVRIYLNSRMLKGEKGKTGRWQILGKEILRYAKGKES